MPENIGKTFLKKTIPKNMPETDHKKGKDAPPLERPAVNETLSLPDPYAAPLGALTLDIAIRERETVRKYSDTPLTLEGLSYLLYATQGVRKEGRKATLRTVPSAGARHAFETYLLINNVKGLDPGLYRYLALSHTLEHLATHEKAEAIQEGCFGQPMISDSAVAFIWVADSYRMTYRYGERGYRYLFLDAGHVSQNLYLAARYFNMGACAIAAYDDDLVNEAIDVDGEELFTAYITTIGEKAE